jgi:hypothetical protein
MTADASGPAAVNGGGILQAFVDLSALAMGDVYEFKVYEKCRTGDTQRAVYSVRFANTQTTPLWASPALVLGVGWDMTLRKVSGGDRAIHWRISKVA